MDGFRDAADRRLQRVALKTRCSLTGLSEDLWHDRARPDTDAEANKQARTKSRSQAKSQGCDV